MPCRNAVSGEEVRRHFESRARQDYVGQQQAGDFVRSALESYIGLTPRATCKDWVLHFTGPSGSGKTFLAEIIASAAFDEWEDEMYSTAQLGAGISSCAGLGVAGLMFGPLAGAIGCATGAVMAYTATDAATHVFTSLSYFRSTKPFPGQCGVLQHKFSRGSDLAEVEAFEYAAAQELLRDPKAVFILDDIGRLSDGAAYEHLGRLLCGVGGNSVPAFRTEKENPELIPAPRALFILTSDLVLGESGAGGGECGAGSFEPGSFEQMLGAVRTQSSQFWAARKQLTPDWWQDLPIVPFRELCHDEITDAVKKYLQRQCDNAGKRLDSEMDRRYVYSLTGSVVHKWIGSVKHGPASLSILENYAGETAERNSLDGGRQGAWVIQDFHHSVMKPAFSRLMLADEHGGTLLSRGGHKRHTSFMNTTTLTYTAEVCLRVTRADAGSLPTVHFEVMKHRCE